MKKLIFPMLSLMMVVSCSKGTNETNDELVPIKLGATINTISAKAVITPTTSSTYGIAGWENSAAEDYTATPKWNTEFTFTGTATPAPITLVSTQYYNASDATKTYMKAWHPKGSLAGNVVTLTNTTGDQDVMLAAPISGSKITAPAAALELKHKTAQISFKVVGDASLTAGTTLTSITVNKVKIPISITLGATDAIGYGAETNLPIVGITALAIPITPVEAIVAGDPIMIEPITGKTFTVDVVTSDATYTGSTVTVATDNITEGTAYVVTLTFKQSGITPTAAVTDWIGSTGAGEII